MSARRVPGHALTLEWSGEYGRESSSTGYCRCGWSESASSQAEVRVEYRHHLRRVVELQATAGNAAPGRVRAGYCCEAQEGDHTSWCPVGNAAPGPRTLQDGTEEEHTTHPHWGTVCMVGDWQHCVHARQAEQGQRCYECGELGHEDTRCPERLRD